MLRKVLRKCTYLPKALLRSLTGKASAVLKGESPVSNSCQIPDIRQKYIELGLLERSGLFVEIGAFDGETLSNTSFLADQGWRGLYVEPVPSFCRRIRLRHALNRISTEALAISEIAGQSELNLMGELSTLKSETLEAYGAMTWAQHLAASSRPVLIKTDTLETVLRRHSIPHDFDLMVIDVEGSEEPVVDSLLASGWRPRVLIVELCDIHPDFSQAQGLQSSHATVRANILSSGYRPFYLDEINSIFARYP